MDVWNRNWWVLLFCVAVASLYFHFMQEKKGAIRQLGARLHQMERDKGLSLDHREELELRIASQNDPAWIEMILIRDLGVVPEGFLKVHFKR